MERVRVKEFGESKDEDYGWVNLVFLYGFSLKILSRSSLQYVGIKVFTLVCVWNAKGQFFPNKVVWRLDLATWLSREFESRANCLARLEVLSCSAPAGVTLQLLCILHTCASFSELPVASQSRDLVARPCWVDTLELFLHSLSHIILTWFSSKYRISKCWITRNLAQNKANKMVY